ncbi:hypothetical protein Leryth_008016 [Lithospermum erythrorhizon]|nr:hypothetical protein Leryth_008016 [Lithospermum erythrorhizon]
MMEISRITESLPYIGLILSQCAQVGLIILSKQAMASGMTNFTFVFYSNALATLILLPSFFFYRSRPPLNFQLICRFFLLGILGCSAQLTGYAGIKYTNASFASTMLNLIPGFTFILAIIFRYENMIRCYGIYLEELSSRVDYSLFLLPICCYSIRSSLYFYWRRPRCLVIAAYYKMVDSFILVGSLGLCIPSWRIVIAAILGISFLGDILYLGSLLGSLIIVIGFYSVMWGKIE